MRALPLHRHQLARLTPSGWQHVLQRDWDGVARDCLTHWATRGLPLVITRQAPVAPQSNLIAMGLPAPGRWGRRRLALQVPCVDVSYFDEFPRLREVVGRLPEARRPAWHGLCDRLDACDAIARVHGSHGWKHLTALDHVQARSDLDLWISVTGATQADRIAQVLDAFPDKKPRLDGELVFGDGSAVAWREWLAWRAGSTKAVLVKRLDGCCLWRHPCDAPFEIREEATA